MPVVTIRDAEPSDLETLGAVEARAFSGDRLSVRSMRRFISAPSARLRVAVAGNARRRQHVVGYHLVLVRKGSPVARLYSIAVEAAARGSGVGGRLLSDAEAMAIELRRTALRLEVREDNAAAIRLYEASGYRPIGRHAAYYADKADALRYEKPLGRGERARSTGKGRGR